MNQRIYRPTKAYKDEAFLNSRDARALRILSEYLEPQARFDRLKVRDTIVFFGSARALSADDAAAALAAAKNGGGDLALAEAKIRMSRYYEDARTLARRLTEWSKSLSSRERRFVICTGGGPGIMEAANRGASEAKGINAGLGISIPMEVSENPYVTRQLGFEFHYFFMRKFWFTYLAKAIVAMPGGFGTMDELFEILTLIQTLKVKKKLPIVLFGTEFWNDVINFDAMVAHGTINAGDLDLMYRTDSVDAAYNFIVRELSAHALTEPGEGL